MKKIVAILLLFSFFLANSGMAVSMHWCGGKITHISFFSNDSHLCSCKKKEKDMKPGCCKDKTAFFKLKSEINSPNNHSFKASVFQIIYIHFNQKETAYLSLYKFTNTFFYYPPPFKPKVPTYITNGVFII
ncbi:MAG: hypothetical protein H7296_09760 [Bacteroidia bacterium]|nr:hypothetical protein [Bacteroidia bacterium]